MAKKNNMKSKRIGRNNLKKGGYSYGLYGWKPYRYKDNGVFMNAYRKGRLERLLLGKTNDP